MLEIDNFDQDVITVKIKPGPDSDDRDTGLERAFGSVKQQCQSSQDGGIADRESRYHRETTAGVGLRPRVIGHSKADVGKQHGLHAGTECGERSVIDSKEARAQWKSGEQLRSDIGRVRAKIPSDYLVERRLNDKRLRFR